MEGCWQILTLGLIVLAALGAASVSRGVQIATTLPGMGQSSNPGEFVASFYQFSLMIGGILAFGAIVYGGVKYTFAAGNPSGQSEGKEWVKSALLGLLLLVGAYIILNTINPDLVKLSLPTFPKIEATTPGGGGSPSGSSTFGGFGGGSSGGGGASGNW